MPDEAYAAKHSYDISTNKINQLDKDFFGYLEYKDWSGNVLFMLRIENGLSVQKLEKQAPAPMKTSGLPQTQRSMVLEAGFTCVTVTVSHQERWCYYDNWFDEKPSSRLQAEEPGRKFG